MGRVWNAGVDGYPEGRYAPPGGVKPGRGVYPRFMERWNEGWIKVAVVNKSIRWRRILVRHPGTFPDAYRGMCRRM
jgi:hypothetical protein